MTSTPETNRSGHLQLRPLASLAAHPRLALLATAAVLAAGVAFAWVKGQPTYHSQALIHVAPRYMKNLRDDQELELQSNTQYRQFVEQQVQTLRRSDVMLEAVRRIGASGGHWRLAEESERAAAERLATVLRVGAIPDTYLIRVGIEGARPEGLATIANAVADAYLEQAKRESLYGLDERRGNLKARSSAIAAELDRKLARRAEIAGALGVSTFVATDLNPFDKLFVDSRDALAEARRKRIEAEARYAAFRDKGVPDPGIPAPRDIVATDPGLNSLKSNLYKRRAELTSTLSGLGPKHPGAVAGKQELEDIDSEVASQIRKLDAEARAGVKAKLEAAVSLARRTEAQLEREAESQRLRSTEYATLYNEALAIGNDIDRLRKDLEQIDDRQNFFDVESQAPGFVYLAVRAADPEFPTGGGRRKLLLVAVVAAALAGVVVPIALDLANRRVRGPRDVEGIFGFAPLAWLAAPGERSAQRFNHSQLRRIAGALLRERDRHGTKAVLFAGIGNDAASAELVPALARTFSELGVRTIVVEARPEDGNAIYATGRPGLVDALLGESTIEACVAPRDGDLPSRIRSGATGDALPALRQLPRQLEALATQADLVLVDGPAVLRSADCDLLVAATKAIVLVTSAHSDSSTELARAGALVARLAPESFGVALVAVDPERAGPYAPELVRDITGVGQGPGALVRAALRRTFALKVA